jgi:hypothetical protein
VANVKNLFDPAAVNEIEQRVQQLRPESRRQWGSMEVAQALAHCTSSLEMALGTLPVKRARFPFNAIGRLIKPLVLRENQPMRRNSPSSPELFATDRGTCEFASEQSRLIAAIERFASDGPAAGTRQPHPFFGPLQPKEWAILMYKHLDHHLRQFGA